MGLASMDEVALCLRFMDLLRQDLLAVGEGMAEASCCPLRLVVTVPPIPLPFIPPGAGMPLTASETEKKGDNGSIIKSAYLFFLKTFNMIQMLKIKEHKICL